MRRLGILQPITVRYIETENIYRIITGERRYHAACEAGLAEIPCWVQSPKEEEVLLHQIVENWQRLDMHPYDLADALARLRDANGYSQQDLARETGKSEGEISKLLGDSRPRPGRPERSRETTRPAVLPGGTCTPSGHSPPNVNCRCSAEPSRKP